MSTSDRIRLLVPFVIPVLMGLMTGSWRVFLLGLWFLPHLYVAAAAEFIQDDVIRGAVCLLGIGSIICWGTVVLYYVIRALS